MRSLRAAHTRGRSSLDQSLTMSADRKRSIAPCSVAFETRPTGLHLRCDGSESANSAHDSRSLSAQALALPRQSESWCGCTESLGMTTSLTWPLQVGARPHPGRRASDGRCGQAEACPCEPLRGSCVEKAGAGLPLRATSRAADCSPDTCLALSRPAVQKVI
jgi:hypothetical protein